MTIAAIITIVVIFIAIILFVTEWLPIDLVALLIMLSLITTGVITAEEGVAGFSNKATITVAFMFIISAALLKTGALQFLTHRLSALFQRNYLLGMLAIMPLIALFSAFINNTPVVAVFIPVMMQVANSMGKSPSKFLIPLSYASIWGGTCTLVGTSTNILVSGIAEKEGLAAFSMFQLLPLGLVFIVIGIVYMLLMGLKILPDRKAEQDLRLKFGVRDYLTELELQPNAASVGQKIMNSPLVRELELDIIEVRRGKSRFTLPPGDFQLQAGDLLKVRCDVDKIKLIKDRARVLEPDASLRIGEAELDHKRSTLIEMVVASNSEFHGRTLRELDFRRRFRAIPLAIRHRKEILHRQLYDCKLKAGDIILAEAKSHYVKELKKMENEQESPFIILSEDVMLDFDQKKFVMVILAILGLVLSAALGWLDIMVAAIAAVSLLVLTRCISMKDAYESINWQVVFLLAGALSLGVAMQNTKLDHLIADQLIGQLQVYGPIAVVSGLYLLTVILTELMSNNATAALMAPIAIATAYGMGLEPMPFLMAVTFAASSSFLTPVGYQTNAMVYSAGQYRFVDFFRSGIVLSILFWLAATLLIPILYPFSPI